MISQQLQILNKSGLHLKPANKLCQEAMKYQSSVTFTYKTTTANVKSVLSILGACVRGGESITVTCDGTDEREAMAGIAGAVASGLGEAVGEMKAK